MILIEYPDRDMLAIDLANRLAGDLVAALEHEERVCFAVPGGGSPKPVFDTLCAADLDWARVDVMLTDERWVPEDDLRSNTKLVKERLLTARAAVARFLPLYAKADQPEDVLPELEAMIAPALPIDVALLGVGADMHTASMFAGGDNLALALDSRAPILVPMRGEHIPETRVTLSARVLEGAVVSHMVAYGQDKRDALEQAATLPPEEAPVAAVLQGCEVHWAP